MRHFFSVLSLGLILAACNAAPAGHHHHVMAEPSRMTIDDRTTDVEIAFAVKDGDKVFQDYGVSHTKEMHLLVVRDDLRHFSHLHPERDANGVWYVPFKAPAGGTYWLYADFVEADGTPNTIRFIREFPGAKGNYGIRKEMEETTKVDGYTVTMSPFMTADGIQFTYRVRNQAGSPVVLQEYLGEKGHSVLISPSGDFVHVHPFKEYDGYTQDADPVFFMPHPKDDFYRIFTQFKINGKVITAEFNFEH